MSATRIAIITERADLADARLKPRLSIGASTAPSEVLPLWPSASILAELSSQHDPDVESPRRRHYRGPLALKTDPRRQRPAREVYRRISPTDSGPILFCGLFESSFVDPPSFLQPARKNNPIVFLDIFKGDSLSP
jgi:hypothetical protein